MKNTQYISPILLLALGLLVSRCTDPDLQPAPDPIWAPVAVVSFTDNVDESFFDATDFANSVFAYELSSEDFDKPSAEVSAVIVNIAYNRGTPQLYGEYPQSELQSGNMISLTGSEAATLFGLDAGDVQLGDVFTFSFSVKTVAGRHHTIYNNNICNLIRVVGDCSLEAHVLNPVVTEVTELSSSYSLSEIDTLGNDLYQMTLDTRTFASSVTLESITVEAAYVNSTENTTSEFVPATSLSSFPADVELSAAELIKLFDLEMDELDIGDAFILRYLLTTENATFTSYDSPNCGKNFSSAIIHPLHYPFLNSNGTAIAPPATPLEGTCQQIITIEE
ncbi:MAG: hypothetical protein AAF223_05495 [Bacteroidota bacterium]